MPKCLPARLLGAVAAALLVACAAPAPTAQPRVTLLQDTWFAPAPPGVSASDLFAMSDEMRRYAETELSSVAGASDPRRRLIAALYTEGKLRLRYDASRTRTAAEAFDARSGNCLSLVIMTAAFARHLDLPLSFQSVRVDDSYTRQGNLIEASGHVNLVLDWPRAAAMRVQADTAPLVVDFLQPSDMTGLRSSALAERTVAAMFMNNRAAEALAQGRLDAAYGWAREAVRLDDGFAAGINTLGVIYDRAGHLDGAEKAMRFALALEPDNLAALSNLASLLRRGGREGEAQVFSERLARLQPVPPFRDFDLGRKALADGKPQVALEHFARELRQQPHQEEVHFWAAQALWQLGDTERAARHLQQAMDDSSSKASHDRYAAKLAALRSAKPQ